MAISKVNQRKPVRPTPEPVFDHGLKGTWREICHKQKPLMITMIILAVLSGCLLFFSFSTLRPQNTVVIVGYGDVYGEIAGISGGYRRDSWLTMLAFPIFAVVLGLLHNLLTIRLYRKYGRDAAQTFAIMSILLVAGAFMAIIRLMGEW